MKMAWYFVALLSVISAFGMDVPDMPSTTLQCTDTVDCHRDCGKQIGSHFAKKISIAFKKDGTLKGMWRLIQGSDADEKIAKTFNALEVYHRRNHPKCIAEIEGMAEGSGQPFAMVLLANFRQEMQTVLTPPKETVSSQSLNISDSCTDIYVRGQGFAHNEDYDSLYFDTVYYLHVKWLDTEANTVFEYASFVYPGVLPGWAPGWNSHGLAISWNVLYPKPMGVDRKRLLAGSGSAVAFVCHQVLSRARNIDEAVHLAAPTDLLLGQNFNVGELRTKRIVTVETAPAGRKDVFDVDERVPTSAPLYYHTNEYLRMPGEPQYTGEIVSSKHRQRAFEKMHPAPVTLEGAVQVLGDTSDAAYPIFRRNDTTQADTLFTVVFDLRNDGSTTIYRDNPQLGKKAVWRRMPLPFGRGEAQKGLQEEDASILV